jgi:enoyl-CoA hydratase/carnithine racemase
MLDLTVDDAVGTVRIKRPEKRNAMSAQMWRALPGLLAELAGDGRVKVVVLTGAEGTFCSGADISDVGRIGGEDLTAAAEEALITFPKPTVAMIEGYCVGGGCQLAAACDLRFAAADALFGIPAAKLGLLYPARTTRRLVSLVGPAAAKLLLFSADLIDAPHALRIGLVDEVLPREALAARVAGLCAAIASRSQLTVQAAKQIVDAVAEGGPVEERAAHWRKVAAASPDPAEGVAAFLERRPPSFTWRA